MCFQLVLFPVTVHFKNPTKGNQTKPFFSLRCFASQFYIQSWIFFCIDMCGPTFSAADWCVLVGCVGHSSQQEAQVTWAPPLTLGWGWVGSGPGEQWNAASNLPAEPVAAFHGLKHMLFRDRGSRVGQEKGKRSTPKNDRDFTRKPDKGQIHWPFRLSIRPGGFHTDQIVWTQRWDNTRCIFELNAVTVQDCRKKTKKL